MPVDVYSAVVVPTPGSTWTRTCATRRGRRSATSSTSVRHTRFKGFAQLNNGQPPAPGSLQFLLAPEYFFGIPLPAGTAGSPVNAYGDNERAQIVAVYVGR